MSTAKEICGDLAFEHGIDDPPDELWRIDFVRYWKDKPHRMREWYASEAAATERAARIESSDDQTVLHVTKYARAAK